MFEKNLNVSLTTPQKKRKYPIYPEIPGNTQEYPEIPDSKKDTRKYPIIYFNTPTRPEPDPLPGIFSNTRPDPILKNPTRWALMGSMQMEIWAWRPTATVVHVCISGCLLSDCL